MGQGGGDSSQNRSDCKASLCGSQSTALPRDTGSALPHGPRGQEATGHSSGCGASHQGHLLARTHGFMTMLLGFSLRRGCDTDLQRRVLDSK